MITPVAILAASLYAQHVLGTATAHEVLLDVVVRDAKGRMVKDLRPEELTVLDNGVTQSLSSFRLISGKPQQTGNPDGRQTLDRITQSLNPGPSTFSSDPTLVTIVFDQLRPEQRPVARAASLDALKIEGANVFFAAFTIDQKLAMLAPYTSDRQRIARAIERATGPTFSLNTDENERIQRQRDLADLTESLEALKGQGDPSLPPSTQQRLLQMNLNMVQFADSSERSQQGRAQFLSLWSLIREQKRLPGRKTLLYLTGGLSVPPEYLASFRALISDANRANVSVYAIDVSGLNTYNANESGSATLRAAASSSRTNMTDRTGIITRDQAQLLDRAELATMSNIQNSLEVLSRDTGGFLTANTNDVRPALRRIAEESTTHYELSYAPGIEKFDGKERRILVTVSRPHASVHTRSGYFALPFEMLPYEGPMLAALNQPGTSLPFSFRSAAEWFPSPSGDPLTAVIVDVPIENITLTRDEDAGNFHMHLSVLHLFRDSSGSIVRKITRDVPGKGELRNYHATRAGHFIHTDHVDLPPGEYMLETAVFDRESLKISTHRQKVIVASQPPAAISSLTLVRSITPTQSADKTNPFEFAGSRVTPELNHHIRPGGRIDLYAVLQGANAAEFTLQLHGRILARGINRLEPETNRDGRLHYLVSISVPESLQSGEYSVVAAAAGIEPGRTLPVTVE